MIKKNELIEKLNAIKGNPEVFLGGEHESDLENTVEAVFEITEEWHKKQVYGHCIYAPGRQPVGAEKAVVLWP